MIRIGAGRFAIRPASLVGDCPPCVWVVAAARQECRCIRPTPVAWLLPFEEERPEPSIRPYEEAWSEIEQALEATEPAYPDWKSALEESRRRR